MNRDKHLKSSREVISDIYNSSYGVINKINNSFFNKIELDDTFTTTRTRLNGKSIISNPGKMFIYIQLDNLVRFDKRGVIKKLALYDTTIRALYDNNIVCVICFLNGIKIHMDSRILISDSYVYIEVPKVEHITNISIYSIHDDMAYSNKIINGNYKYIGFKDGKLNNDTPDEVYYSKIIFTPSILNIDNDNLIDYEAINIPIDVDNIMSFDANNTLQYKLNARYLCDGIIECKRRVDKGNVYFLINDFAKKNYITKLDYYKSLADYRLDMAQDNVPDLVKQFEHLVLNAESVYNEKIYNDTFSNILENEPEHYSKYLNKMISENIIHFRYKDLLSVQKNLFHNADFTAIDPDIHEFYTERFMISFSNRNNYDYCIFINGKIIHIYDIIRHTIGGVEYVFINKQSLIDELDDDTIFEVVLFEKEYLRKDLVIQVDDDAVIKMDTLIYPSLKNIRFYIDGVYISREHIRFHEKSNSIDGYYIFCELPIKKGSTVTIENYFISDEYIIDVDVTSSSIVEIEEAKLLYPLSPLFYDIYVNGIKQYDVQAISTNVIKINNMKSNNKLMIMKKRFIDDFLYMPEYGRAVNRWDRYIKSIGVDSFINGNDIVLEQPNYNMLKYDSYQFLHYQLFNLFILDKYIDCMPHNNDDIWNNFKSLITEHPNLIYPIVILDASEKMIVRQPVNSSLSQYRKEVEDDDYRNYMTKVGVIDASTFTKELEKYLPIYGIPLVYYDEEGNEQIMYDSNAVHVNADNEAGAFYPVPSRFVEDFYNKPIDYNITGVTMSNSNVIPINDVYNEISSVKMYHTEDAEWVIKKI